MIGKKVYENRKTVMIGIILLTGIVLVARLVYVQLIEDKYMLSAANNVLRYMTQYPARGIVFDRNKKMLVFNETAYDLMVTPRLVKKVDTLEFCHLIGITKEEFKKKMIRARNYSSYRASVFEEQISKENYGYIEEKLFKFQGFYVQPRTLRKYPRPIAAHILGYVGEVSPMEIEANPYYKQSDYIGKSGLEKSYEEVIRGEKGLKIKMVDVFNREKGNYMDGKYDTVAIPGNDLYVTIDAELQAYGELLMKNKRGSIVAIEPATGEILALVSSPAYDPNLLIGRVRSKNYNQLATDTLKPLFNRALLAQYPPGSTFKLVDALIGQQEQVLTTETRYSCAGVGSSPIKCSHNHYSPLNLVEAIEQSCNPYFWNVFKSIIDNRKYKSTTEAYIKWREYVMSFNLGKTFNSDMTVERSGNVPDPTYYDKYFGKNSWRSMTIRSLSIGQGELLVTPLQLANVTAIIANRGYYYIPHLVRAIGVNGRIIEKNWERKNTLVSQHYFYPVVEGMFRVFNAGHGTARYYSNDSIQMCGKTGTVQNPHGKDHSIFLAFAPKDNPKIAISVIVENAGFGSTYAAPIATLMINKYILREFEKPWFEEKILNTNLNLPN